MTTTPSRAFEADARALHRSAYVADAHADALLWNRDLRVRQRRGHLDFVRLAEAGVRLQVFTVVSRVSVHRWVSCFAWRTGGCSPPFESRSRTLFQIDRLTEACRSGVAALATSPATLASAEREGKLACVLGVEGGHALEGRVDRVGELARRGVAFLGLTHLVPNELGGSSFPFRGRLGLTALGGRVLEAMAVTGWRWTSPTPAPPARAPWPRRSHASSALTPAAALDRGGATSTTRRSAGSPTGAGWRAFTPDALSREPAARSSGGPPRARGGVAGEEAVVWGATSTGGAALGDARRDGPLGQTALLLERGHPDRIERILGSSGASSPRSWGRRATPRRSRPTGDRVTGRALKRVG